MRVIKTIVMGLLIPIAVMAQQKIQQTPGSEWWDGGLQWYKDKTGTSYQTPLDTLILTGVGDSSFSCVIVNPPEGFISIQPHVWGGTPSIQLRVEVALAGNTSISHVPDGRFREWCWIPLADKMGTAVVSTSPITVTSEGWGAPVLVYNEQAQLVRVVCKTTAGQVGSTNVELLLYIVKGGE